MTKFYISTLLLFFSVLHVFGQAPQKFSYQAILRDSSDVIVSNAAVGLQISILHNSTSGTVVYKETHSVTTNSFGQISIEIGSGNTISGSMAAIDWSSGSYFIQMEADPNGGTSYTISGNTQLLSVPYALHASTAATGGADDLGSHVATQNIQTSTNFISNDGTNDGIYINPGNKVGIGTSNPDKKLNVAGGLRVEGSGLYLKNRGFILAKNTGGNDQVAIVPRTGSDNFVLNAENHFLLNTNQSGTIRNRLFVGRLGKVGIGTTRPNRQLHITGGMRIDGSGLYLNNNRGIMARNTRGQDRMTIVPRSSTNQMILHGGAKFNVTTVSGGQNTVKMVIDQKGRMGLSRNPYFRLDVNGIVRAARYYTYSDSRLKTNITELSSGLDKILMLNPVTYNLIESDSPSTDIGFIAQDLEKVIPEAVVKPVTEDSYYSVNYTELIPVLVKAVQEQQAVIDEQDKEIEELKKLVQALLDKSQKSVQD